MSKNIFIVLDNIRSVHNVGSIFRTCDGAGVKKIYLCGVTPCPIDRFGRERSDLAKVALGAQNTIQWQQVSDTLACIEQLKKDGVSIVAVEQDERAINYKDLVTSDTVAYVFGTEVTGLSPDVLNACDAVVEIPLAGLKESLNVSVAVGIILFNNKDT